MKLLLNMGSEMLQLLTLILVTIGTSESRLVLRSPYDLYFFYDYHGSLNSGSHTYEQARMFCEGIGGQLPSFHGEDDINFVLNKLIGERSKGNHIWSGLYWSDTLNSQDPSRSDKPTDENRWALGHYHNTGKHLYAYRTYQERVVCRLNLTDPEACRRLTTSFSLQRLDPHEAKWICKNLVIPTTTTTTEATTTTTTTSTTPAPTTADYRRILAQFAPLSSCPPCPRSCPTACSYG